MSDCAKMKALRKRHYAEEWLASETWSPSAIARHTENAIELARQINAHWEHCCECQSGPEQEGVQ
jgi:hypothetical protein